MSCECGWIEDEEFKKIEMEVAMNEKNTKMHEPELRLAPLKRLVQRKALRNFEDKPFNVSRDATLLLRKEVELQVENIGELACKVARDQGRVTIKAEDVATAENLLTPKWEDEVLERGHCPNCFSKMEDNTNPEVCDFSRIYTCPKCGKTIMTMKKLGSKL